MVIEASCCDHGIHGGIVLIARHLQEPSETNWSGLQGGPPFEATVLFTVGRDVAKGLDTTEPCSDTWDAWDANGDRGGTSGNVQEGTKGEGSGRDGAPALSARDPEPPLWKFVSTTVGADGGNGAPCNLCGDPHFRHGEDMGRSALFLECIQVVT